MELVSGTNSVNSARVEKQVLERPRGGLVGCQPAPFLVHIVSEIHSLSLACLHFLGIYFQFRSIYLSPRSEVQCLHCLHICEERVRRGGSVVEALAIREQPTTANGTKTIPFPLPHVRNYSEQTDEQCT